MGDERTQAASRRAASEVSKRPWFSPHGTEWEAESYEEALEMERDSLVEQLRTAREALAFYDPADDADAAIDFAQRALSNPAKERRCTCPQFGPRLAYKWGDHHNEECAMREAPSPAMEHLTFGEVVERVNQRPSNQDSEPVEATQGPSTGGNPSSRPGSEAS